MRFGDLLKYIIEVAKKGLREGLVYDELVRYLYDAIRAVATGYKVDIQGNVIKITRDFYTTEWDIDTHGWVEIIIECKTPEEIAEGKDAVLISLRGNIGIKYSEEFTKSKTYRELKRIFVKEMPKYEIKTEYGVTPKHYRIEFKEVPKPEIKFSAEIKPPRYRIEFKKPPYQE